MKKAIALLFLLFPWQALAAGLPPVSTNDTFLGKQWPLDAISARDGWNAATGSRDVVVAVIDGGMDITHEDLAKNIWTNTGEIAGNRKDDDGNGYVDDVHGWNFVTGSPDVEPQVSASGPEEAWIHATAVASVIAAEGNNDIGIAGVAWKARIMPLVVLDSNGYGTDGYLIRAIRYAVAEGADIINLSLYGAEFDAPLAQAVREATAQGVLVVSAAGNSDVAGGDNLNLLPGYPACDIGSDEGKLTVTALDRDLKKANHANYGSCVDIAAPGSDIFAARPPRDAHGRQIETAGYAGGLTGTSIAAPFVSGLAALLKSRHPSWRSPELARRILETADSVDDANPLYRGALGRGVINVQHALETDQKSRAYGPLTLEGSAPGMPPEVRILAEDGTEIRRFAVGDSGDVRGVRAAFLRARGNFEPDIAVTTVGDGTGAWRIYRSDGLLIAAGSLGSVNGGLTLAAEDLDSSGTDTLFLGEANGRRAWLLSPLTSHAKEVQPFATSTARGIAALSLGTPVPAFLVMTTKGDAMVSAIGRNGERLDVGATIQSATGNGWIVRRGERPGLSAVYQSVGSKKTITYLGDSTGIHEIKTAPTTAAWVQNPLGDERHPGWRAYDLWPR